MAAKSKTEKAIENLEKEESVATSQQNEVPKNLIAVYPILFRSKQYKPGDILPADDSKMVQAWIGANTAEWQEIEKISLPKARMVTAPSGLVGDIIPPNGRELVGRVSKR